MDYREKYLELLEQNKQLENALKSYHPNGIIPDFAIGKSQQVDGLETPEDFYKQGVFFEKFADMLPEMVYEIDISGKILYSNRQAIEYFGYLKEDIAKGINISEFFPESHLQMRENLKDLKEQGQISSNEYIARKKDGTTVPVVTHTFATFLNGQIIGYRGVLSDISRQKLYEAQLTREKAFLEDLYNATPVAIAITNLTGIISMINREFTNLFGFTPEEAVSKNINDIIVPDDHFTKAARSEADHQKGQIREKNLCLTFFKCYCHQR
jgi:PAS domain S-box-containing protein